MANLRRYAAYHRNPPKSARIAVKGFRGSVAAFGGNNARSSRIYLSRRVCCALMPALIQGERNKKMAEHRRIWPLLVYAGLAAIAAARRKETERTSENGSYGTVRKPYRTIYPAP